MLINRLLLGMILTTGMMTLNSAVAEVPADTVRFELHGEPVISTPENFEVLKRLLGARPPVSWGETSKNCSLGGEDETLCRLTRMIGSRNGAELTLFLAKEYELFLSLDQTMTRRSMTMVFDPRTYQSYVDYAPPGLEKLWSESEIGVVASVLKLLPKSLTSFDHMKDLYILPEKYFLIQGRSLPSKRPSTIAVTKSPGFLDGKLRSEGFMAFFPYSGFQFGDNEQTRSTLIHELAHAYDHQEGHRNRQSVSEREEWWSISWVRSGHQYYPRDEVSFVSKYAMTSPVEDFAESVSEFFMNPARLKKVSPEKHSFCLKLFSPDSALNGEG